MAADESRIRMSISRVDSTSPLEEEKWQLSFENSCFQPLVQSTDSIMMRQSADGVYEWLIALLQAGDGEKASLRHCMEVGEKHGEIRVLDANGAEHRHGDTFYEDAHLLSVRKAVDEGIVEPVFENEEQRAAWRHWIAGDPLDTATRASILDIELAHVCQPHDADAGDARTPYQRAKDHLLDILKSEGRVRYTRFYDGTVETEDLMRCVCGLNEDDDSAEILMDDVVWDLRKAGVVRTTELSEELSDGNKDYLIELIKKQGD